jgi:hypothetical protein
MHGRTQTHTRVRIHSETKFVHKLPIVRFHIQNKPTMLCSVSTFQSMDHLSTTDVRSGLRKVDSIASHVFQSNTPHVFIMVGGGDCGWCGRPGRQSQRVGKMGFKRINFHWKCVFCPKNLKLLMYNKMNISKEVMVLNFAVFVKGGHTVFIRH